LNRERICREALALVDEEGLDALSMRRLGARLGVEAMSLYRHVRDKADLLDAIHAAVLGELKPISEANDHDWRGLLGGLAEALRAALLRHPNVVSLFATRPVSAPEAMVMLQRVWAALERAGFKPLDAQRAIIAIGVYTVGHTLGEAKGQPAAHLGAPTGPGHAEFHFGLDAFLEGIARHARGGTRKR
jgi:AcrR family transcriptional regulator